MHHPALFVQIVTVTLLWATMTVQVGWTAEAKPIDFARDVFPILQKQCFECHGPDEQEGQLRQ
jgi:hypothetical protein